MQQKKEYYFSLILSGVNEDTPGIEDAFYEADCDDALIYYRYGTVYLDFEREGADLLKVILTAINEVENAGVDARVVTVLPEPQVTLSDIAKRTGLTRQAIENYVAGRRGGGDFPLPISKIESRSALWRWSEVVQWLYANSEIQEPTIISEAKILELINLVLDIRSNKTDLLEIRDILISLNSQNDEYYQNDIQLKNLK